MSYFQVRTDLALEAREYVEGANQSLRGVSVEEYDRAESDIHVTKVHITTKNGEKILGKPMGTYITLEVPNLCEMGENTDVSENHTAIAKEISRNILSLLPTDMKEASILVVGLGNRDITADALGPRVIEKVEVTRHLLKEYGSTGKNQGKITMVSAIAPSVMAKTGMESAEIIKGVVLETNPDLVIVIDALAARSTRRLNRTVQISNTGIHPGSGVGNHRNAIDEKTLKVPVIAIGVPTVVDAATIVLDALGSLHSRLNETTFLQARDSLAISELNNMYVTPKDIDSTIKRVSFTLSEALNLLLFTGKNNN